jgi:hypothetical protein
VPDRQAGHIAQGRAKLRELCEQHIVFQMDMVDQVVLDGTTLADLIAPLQSPGKVVVSGPRSRKPALLPGIPVQRA